MRQQNIYYSLFKKNKRISPTQFFAADEIRFYLSSKRIADFPLFGSASDKRELYNGYLDLVEKDVSDFFADIEKVKREVKFEKDVQELLNDIEFSDGEVYYFLSTEYELLGSEEFSIAEKYTLFKDAQILLEGFFPPKAKASTKREIVADSLEKMSEEKLSYTLETKEFWRYSPVYSSHIKIRKINILLNQGVLNEVNALTSSNIQIDRVLKDTLEKAVTDLYIKESRYRQKSIDGNYLARISTPLISSSNELKSAVLGQDGEYDNINHNHSFGMGISRSRARNLRDFLGLLRKCIELVEMRIYTYFFNNAAAGFLVTGFSMETVIETAQYVD